MTYPSLRDQISGKCKHFTGIKHEHCKAGIAYETFKKPHYRLPCISEDASFRKDKLEPIPCELREELTGAEIDAQVAEIEDAIARHSKALASGKCPHCGAPCEPREQVGHCVYGACGCRLYHGSV